MSAPTVTWKLMCINPQRASKFHPNCFAPSEQSSLKMISRITDDTSVSASPFWRNPCQPSHRLNPVNYREWGCVSTLMRAWCVHYQQMNGRSSGYLTIEHTQFIIYMIFRSPVFYHRMIRLSCPRFQSPEFVIEGTLLTLNIGNKVKYI